jgi:hypothetical protein
MRSPQEWPTEEYPDGSVRFRRVIAHEKATLNTYIEAITRLNRFMLDGTIPNDVQKLFVKEKALAMHA